MEAKKLMRGSKRLTNDILDLCLIIPPESTGIEVGCFQGESSKMFCESGKFNELYCVDPWSPGYYKTHSMQEIEQQFDAAVKDYNIVKLKMTSDAMFEKMVDPRVNFIYIDGDHSYAAVKRDIENALKLLEASQSKRLKILAGHDYKHPSSPGVEKAVKELLGYPDIRFAGWSWAKIINR